MTRKFQVGDFIVEPDLNRISRGDTAVSIEPKVLNVLVCLAERPGEVLTREEILRAVWPDTHVTEEVLTYSISALRKALGDDARDPHVIQTISRRGYRLIAQVQAAAAPGPPSLPSVAVLAFSDMSQEKNHEYFCDGIAEEITNRLTHLRGLRVAARTSAFAFKGQAEDVRTIGRKLGVGAVLEGSVRKAGTRLRITAQLINVADGCHLWSASFDRESEDIFAIQDEISQKVVRALEVELSDRERSILGKAPTQSVEAYEFYLRGRQFFYKSKRRSIQCALEMLTRAAGKDPTYAQAWAGMADCYSYLFMYFDNDQFNLELAREMSRTSLELDPDLAEAHSACGLAASLSKLYSQAEREFQAAVRLNPHLFEAYYFYGRTCFVQGKLEEAARLFEQAESVKPDDCQAASLLAFTCRTLGQVGRAEAAYCRTLAKVRKQLELNPDDSRAIYLGATALMELGNPAEGLEWARRSYDLDPDDPYIVYGIACFHSRMGMIEEAVTCFEQAVRAGFSHVEWIKNDSDFDPIRDHPRFLAALHDLENRPARLGIGATFPDAHS
jgi:adenylate cyclase